MKKIAKAIGKIIVVWCVIFGVTMMLLLSFSDNLFSEQIKKLSSISYMVSPFIVVIMLYLNKFKKQSNDKVAQTNNIDKMSATNIINMNINLKENLKAPSLIKPKVRIIKNNSYLNDVLVALTHAVIAVFSIAIFSILFIVVGTIIWITTFGPQYDGFFILLPLVMFISFFGASGLKMMIVSWILLLLYIGALIYIYKITISFINKRYIILNKNRVSLWSVLFWFTFQFFSTIPYFLSAVKNPKLYITLAISLCPYVILYFINKHFFKNTTENENVT